tara:strand:+ start:206 stop:466 length:261 start_codon:yes stop_codon:yes gene_type:complete
MSKITDRTRGGFVDKIESIQEQILGVRQELCEMVEDDFYDYEDPFEISIDNLMSIWFMLQSCVSDLEPPDDYSVLTILSKPQEVTA